MVTPELIDYIKKARAAGTQDEQIKLALLEKGWAEVDINEGLGSSGISVISVNSSQKTSSKTIIIAVGIAFLIFFAIVIAGIVFGFRNAREKAQENQNAKADDAALTSKTDQEQKLKSGYLGAKTVNGVNADFSIDLLEGRQEVCSGEKNSKKKTDSGYEITICVKAASCCDKIDGLDFDAKAEEKNSKLLLKYNHKLGTGCDCSGSYAQLVYKITNLPEGEMDFNVAVNQPQAKIKDETFIGSKEQIDYQRSAKDIKVSGNSVSMQWQGSDMTAQLTNKETISFFSNGGQMDSLNTGSFGVIPMDKVKYLEKKYTDFIHCGSPGESEAKSIEYNIAVFPGNPAAEDAMGKISDLLKKGNLVVFELKGAKMENFQASKAGKTFPVKMSSKLVFYLVDDAQIVQENYQ
jgi:hypothetical protein